MISIGALSNVGDGVILCGGHSVGLIMVGEPLTVVRSVTSEMQLRQKCPPIRRASQVENLTDYSRDFFRDRYASVMDRSPIPCDVVFVPTCEYRFAVATLGIY